MELPRMAGKLMMTGEPQLFHASIQMQAGEGVRDGERSVVKDPSVKRQRPCEPASAVTVGAEQIGRRIEGVIADAFEHDAQAGAAAFSLFDVAADTMQADAVLLQTLGLVL
jgi:hypothetical protein